LSGSGILCEVVDEAAVDDAIGVCGAVLQAIQVVEGASMCLCPDGGQCLSSLF